MRDPLSKKSGGWRATALGAIADALDVVSQTCRNPRGTDHAMALAAIYRLEKTDGLKGIAGALRSYAVLSEKVERLDELAKEVGID